VAIELKHFDQWQYHEYSTVYIRTVRAAQCGFSHFCIQWICFSFCTIQWQFIGVDSVIIVLVTHTTPWHVATLGTD
jgi:hypothetical protein